MNFRVFSSKILVLFLERERKREKILKETKKNIKGKKEIRKRKKKNGERKWGKRKEMENLHLFEYFFTFLNVFHSHRSPSHSHLLF